jgi:hypothetical protein
MDEMKEIAVVLAPYGLPGVLLLVATWLLYKLIDRGFTFQVPTRRSRGN